MPEPALATSLATHYRIERELGAGGMATGYLARDKHDWDVAIKVLHPDLAESLGRERFLRDGNAQDVRVRLTASRRSPGFLLAGRSSMRRE